MELPDWTDVTWVISIDGTEEAFEKMRAPGIYNKIKENIRRHPHFANSDFVRYHESDERLYRRFD